MTSPAYTCKACGAACIEAHIGEYPLDESPPAPRKACTCDGPIIAHLEAPVGGFMFFAEASA